MRRLPEAALRNLSLILLADLQEARVRLAQNPRNSSRPPSSRPPWERGTPAAEPAPEEMAPEPAAMTPDHPRADTPEVGTTPGADTAQGRREGQAVESKPGKQPGAAGRTRGGAYRGLHRPRSEPVAVSPSVSQPPR